MIIKNTTQPGKVYQTVNDVWIYNEGNAPDRGTQTHLKTTDRNDFPPTVWSKGNLPYVKTSYDENGQMEQGSHGGGYQYGNSLLVLGAEQKVELTSWNEEATERKVNYDIGRNENIINYRIAPQLIGEADIDGVTVKLTTTLPKGLEYVAGSSNYREPDITNDSNGTTTLVWEIYDCSVGESIRTIDFKVHIDEETANGTQYSAQTVILADTNKVGNADELYRKVTNTIRYAITILFNTSFNFFISLLPFLKFNHYSSIIILQSFCSSVIIFNLISLCSICITSSCKLLYHRSFHITFMTIF